MGNIELVANVEVALGPGGRVYVPDSGADALYVLRDLDQDGDANDAGEASIFFDQTNAEGFTFTDTRSVAVDAEGIVYLVASPTFGASGIIRLEDHNADGDANDAAEASIFFIEEAEELHRVRVVWDGTILVVLGSADILRLDDADGDGVISGLESSIFASQDVNTYEGLAQMPDGVVYAAVPQNKTIWRFEDTNGDGDALDPDEAKVAFSEPTLAWNFSLVAGPDGGLFVSDSHAGNQTLCVMVDENGNCTFEPGEIQFVYVEDWAASPLLNLGAVTAEFGNLPRRPTARRSRAHRDASRRCRRATGKRSPSRARTTTRSS